MPTWIKMAAGALIVVSLWGYHTYDKKMAVRASIQATEASMSSEYNNKLAEAKNNALLKERQLQKDKDEALKKKDNEIKNINNKLNSVLSSLQFYKECSSSTAEHKDTKIRTACPGAELSREDAEFLAREAARADKVLKDRDYYYERYEDVRQELETQ